MRYALFSDVHANYQAFQSILKDSEQERVQRYVFIGDIVGYGAEPKACIAQLRDLMKRRECISVAGNHDYAVAGTSSYEQYNVYAQESIEWTKKQLDEEEREFLIQLPLVRRVPLHEQHKEHGRISVATRTFTVVHANLVAPEQWGYILDIDDAHPSFMLMEDQLCFIGHSHKPLVFVENEFIDWFIEDKVEIQKDTKYIINIGSVGQPRDGNPDACYAILDDETHCVEIRRVAYDISKAQEKILNTTLPRILADRLSVGK